MSDDDDGVLVSTLAELRSDLRVSEAEVDAGLAIPMAAALRELRAVRPDSRKPSELGLGG